jgi:hypothetical protein
MTAPIASPVHFYDTFAHRILCGVRGVDHHSTKHSRSVTCRACVTLLIEHGKSQHAPAGTAATLEPIAP